MIDVSSNPRTLVLTGVFDGYAPSELFAMWVVPDFLERWWPERAEVESGNGGSYRFEWPSRGWILSGTYTAWEPGQRLGFTWNWSHEPGDKREVAILLEPEGTGTQLTLHQGPYGEESEEQTHRDAHREGWMHFCMRLAGLRPGDLTPTQAEPESVS